MPNFSIGEYNREKAVTYARRWAFDRNPDYYNFDELGGDCTNFASQSIYAGTGIMNYQPTYGWFYASLNNRAPAWTSVIYLYHFLTANKGVGPFGRQVAVDQVQEGDLVQLILDQQVFQHSPMITFVPKKPELDTILIAAHSQDCVDRPLSTYDFKGIRFIHIDGFRRLK